MPILPTPLVSVDELAQQIDNKQLVLLDASWYMPAMNRNGEAEWQEQRIANAQHFDFHSSVCDLESEYPHTMPSAERFTECVQALGVNNDNHIVVYDGQGLFASPRVWWMFKAMGHKNISVLNGGFPAWKDAGLAINTARPSIPVKGDFVAKPVSGAFTDTDSILANLQSDQITVVDARGKGRFDGTEAEPRADIRSGHIPESKNLPFTDLIVSGFFKPQSELQAQFSNIAPINQQLVFTCGSGVTACHLALAAELSGYKKLSVYDGSWSEWGSKEGLPIENS